VFAVTARANCPGQAPRAGASFLFSALEVSSGGGEATLGREPTTANIDKISRFLRFFVQSRRATARRGRLPISNGPPAMPSPFSSAHAAGVADKKALLRSHPFFRGLDGRIVDALVPYAVTRKIKRGTLLFRKGDAGTSFYVVCAGAVRVSAPSDQGKDAVFNLIVPGEIFGEIAFLDGGPRTADAVMIESGELMVIERRDFLPLLRQYPELALRLLEILCGRLRRTSQQLEDIVFLDLEPRLAKALLYLYERSFSESMHKLKVTQRDISQLVGISRESANKQLRSWERRKWLRLERGGLTILAPASLRKLVDKKTAED
jgi:CRP/FNR family cyclic AMP-dependent transcriptional regulator